MLVEIAFGLLCIFAVLRLAEVLDARSWRKWKKPPAPPEVRLHTWPTTDIWSALTIQEMERKRQRSCEECLGTTQKPWRNENDEEDAERLL